MIITHKAFDGRRLTAATGFMAACLAIASFLVQDKEGLAQDREAKSVTNDNDAIARDVLAWRKEHEERFRSPDGWLALTGHYWLEPGMNRFGSEPDAKIKLPAEAAQAVRGSFTVDPKGRVTLEVEAGERVRLDDQPLSGSQRLEIDSVAAEADGRDKITIGDRLKLQLVRRAGRLAVRVRDSQSELIRKFQGKHWFPVQASLRVPARFVRFESPKPLRIVNIRGDELESLFVGQLEFSIAGQPYTLDAIEEAPGKLFVIFKDATNGKTSYGAGRFVDVSLPESGDPVIDFNKCTSPPCAWSPHTLCPLPPKQNHLPIAITAGESHSASSAR